MVARKETLNEDIASLATIAPTGVGDTGNPSESGTNDPTDSGHVAIATGGNPGQSEGTGGDASTGGTSAGTEPVKRKPGRPRGSRNRSGGTPAPNPSIGGTGSTTDRTGGVGGANSNRSGATGTGGESGTESDTGAEIPSVAAEVESPKPRATRGSGGGRRSKKKAGITSEHVQDWGSRGFDAVASFRGPHWKVQKEEIAPFAGDAAKVMNDALDKMDEGTAAKVAALSAGLSVAVGVAMLVIPRAYVDVQLARARKPVPEVPMPDPNEYHPETETHARPLGNPRPAMEGEPVSVHPRETIPGLNVIRGGLT